METAKIEKTMRLIFKENTQIFEIIATKQVIEKSEELVISIRNKENEVWNASFSQQNLLDLDPIFKKIPDLSDVIDLIQENYESGTIAIKNTDENIDFFIKAKFIKTESNVKFRLFKTSKVEENPLLKEIRLLRNEIQRLKQGKKIPVINYIGELRDQEVVSGTLKVSRAMIVSFHIFIEYKTEGGFNELDENYANEEENYGNIINDKVNVEESLSIKITNDMSNKTNPKEILRTWHGTYQDGSGYNDSKSVSFIFAENVLQGNNQISLIKNGKGSQIYTLYLIAEISE